MLDAAGRRRRRRRPADGPAAHGPAGRRRRPSTRSPSRARSRSSARGAPPASRADRAARLGPVSAGRAPTRRPSPVAGRATRRPPLGVAHVPPSTRTRCGWSPPASSTTRARRAPVAVAGRAGRRPRAAGQPPRLRPRRRGRRRHGHGHLGPRLGRRSRPRPTTACPGARAAVVVQPARRTGRRPHRRQPPRSSTCGWRPVTPLARTCSGSTRCCPATSTSPSSLIVLVKVLRHLRAPARVGACCMVWFERKIIADMQNRIGPNRAGPFGLLQTLADGIKLFFKEDLIPDRADRVVFKLAPFLSLVPAFLIFSIIPIGGDFIGDKQGAITISGHDTFLQLADPPIGHPAVLAMSSIAVYGVMLAGWSSGSKYPLLGSVRASAQMVSYEAALGLSVVAVVLLRRLAVHPRHRRSARPARLRVELEPHRHWASCPFVIFLIAGTAEINRPPFDLVEAEQELVGGFHTEYSSHPLRALLPRRVHEHRSRCRRSSSRCSSAARRARCLIRPGGGSWGIDLVRGQAVRLPVRLRVVPGHAASPPLRPAHGPRLEGAHPALARVALMLAAINVSRDQGWNLVRGRRHRLRRCSCGAYGLPRRRRCAPAPAPT